MLLETLVYITEFPTPILGGFDSQFLELPEGGVGHGDAAPSEVFLGGRRNGNLAPHFIAVMNTTRDPEDLVRNGNERVSARPIQRRPLLLAAGSKEEAGGAPRRT